MLQVAHLSSSQHSAVAAFFYFFLNFPFLHSPYLFVFCFLVFTAKRSSIVTSERNDAWTVRIYFSAPPFFFFPDKWTMMTTQC